MKLFNYLIFLPFYINPKTLSIAQTQQGINGIPVGAVIIFLYLLFSIRIRNRSRVANKKLKAHPTDLFIFFLITVIAILISFIADSYKIFQFTAFTCLFMVILSSVRIRWLNFHKAATGLLLFVILHSISLLIYNSSPDILFGNIVIHGSRSSYIVIISLLLVYLFSKLANGRMNFFYIVAIFSVLFVGYKLRVDAFYAFILLFLCWIVTFQAVKGRKNKLMYTYSTSVLFMGLPLVLVLFFYVFNDLGNIYEPLNIRIRVWFAQIDHIGLIPDHLRDGSAHNFILDIFENSGYFLGVTLLVGFFYISLSILNRVVGYMKISSRNFDREIILFVGLLIVIAIQNIVNSGLSQPIVLVFALTIVNEVMISLKEKSAHV
jgi:hypothetical protein